MKKIDTPLVSIGMPVFNNENLIKDAITSLRRQNYPNIEIIICDDNSSDRTPDVCREIKDSRIKFYQNPQNLGATRNHEYVLELSGGKYFVWASTDDRWSYNYVSVLAQALQDNSGAVLAYPKVKDELRDFSSLKLLSLKLPIAQRLNNLLWFEESMGKANIIHGLIRTDTLKNVGAFKSYGYGEWGTDNILVLRLALEGNFLYIPEATLSKKITEENMNRWANTAPDEYCHLMQGYFLGHRKVVEGSRMSSNEKDLLLMSISARETEWFSRILKARSINDTRNIIRSMISKTAEEVNTASNIDGTLGKISLDNRQILNSVQLTKDHSLLGHNGKQSNNHISKKILFLTVGCINYDCNINFYNPLTKIFEKVINYNYLERLSQIGKKNMNDEIVQIIQREEPAYVLLHTYQDQIDHSTLDKINILGAKVVAWFSDDHWRFDSYSQFIARRVFCSITTDKGTIKKYDQLDLKVIRSQWASNQSYYKPISTPFIHDVSFVGQNYGKRKDNLDFLISRGVPVSIYGKGFGKFLEFDEIIKLFNASRINLNFSGSSADEKIKQIKGRVFEVPMCGGFLLTEYSDEIEKYFDIDKEIACFENCREAEEKIRYYLKNPDRRLEIAKNAYIRALKDHTWEKRLRDIFNDLETIEESAGASCNYDGKPRGKTGTCKTEVVYKSCIPPRKKYEIGFHGDSYLLNTIDHVLPQCDVFIETGAYMGDTLEYVARNFRHLDIFSCEPKYEHFTAARNKLSPFLNNITLEQSLSPDFFHKIINTHPDLINKNVAFWLDAHSFGFKWPLKDEIKFITENFERAYIFIDDFKIPGRPDFQYDSYGDQECSWEFIRHELCNQKRYSIYLPKYKEKTSRHHPLVGWLLIEFGNPEMHLPCQLEDYAIKTSCHELSAEMKTTQKNDVSLEIPFLRKGDHAPVAEMVSSAINTSGYLANQDSTRAVNNSKCKQHKTENSGKNVVLVTSEAPEQSPFSTTEKRPPIGIGFLISVLKKAGHNVFFIDNYLSPSNFLDTDYLQANDIQFVGIYANTICYRNTLCMLYKLEWFRQTGRWKGKIIVGGPHTTVCLSTIPDFVDYVVQGEGEAAIIDIVEGKVNERVVNYPRIKNLDELPMPAWEYFVDLPYSWSGDFFSENPVFTMNTSRGCPFSCKFCSVHSIWGKKYTYFSAERIVSDIEYLIKEYNAKGFYFREDNFTLNRKRLIKFCDLLKEKNIRISWACESRVNTLDEEIVKLMAEAGVCGFYLGVESGSQKILNFLKKDITVDQTREAFRLCHKYGIKTAASVVVGVPTETKENIGETLSLLSDIKPTVTWFNVFVGIPNSDLYQYTLDNKLHEFIDDRGLVYLKGHNERVNAFYGGQWDACIPVNISQEPKISVIMSVYNGENYLKEAVLSILNQTYQDFEFIIVDDASTDKTLDILKGFDDPRIKIISNSENCGLTESLNKAIRSARGNYIARMDADDISLPHRFERQLEFLEKTPGYALTGSSYYRINESGKIDRLINVLTDDGELKKGLKKQNWFGHGSVMMKREVVLENGGYNVKFKFAQDYDLWLRIADNHKLANSDEPLYCWRSTISSISREKEEEQRYYAKMAISEANKRASKNGDAERREPLISVIVPTFNRPRMLEASIKSILSQTYQNFEIIVVNDAGENVSESIRKFQDLRIKYIQHENNKGLAAARNTGIKNASGLYIALLDDDDIFYNDHLELAAKCLSDDIPVIYTDAVRATYTKRGDTYKLIKKHVPYSIEFDRNKLLIGNISPVNCFVFNKKLGYKAGLFDETLRVLEDWDFWIRLSDLAAFKHIANATVQVNWRTDGTTMTSLLGSEFKKSRERIYKRYQNQINGVPNLQEIMEEFQQIWANDNQIQTSLTSIIILTCNQLAYTKKCIENIFKHTHCPYELIVVDNGSTDGTVEFLESELLGRHTAARIKIIKNRENKGFAGGNNQGMTAASGDYVLLLNNDVVVTPGWLDRMISCAEKRSEIGIVGPRSNYVSGPQLVEKVDYDTHTLRDLTEFSNKFADNHAEQVQQILRVVGFCMLIKRAVIDKIGGMDDCYGLGNFEDDDFSLRATIAGFQSWIAMDCFIHHFGHRTFIGEKVDLSESLHKNWGVFKDKWGLPAEKPYGVPYRLSEIKNSRFDPSIHYYPLENERSGMKKFGNDSKKADALYATIRANLNTRPSKEVIEDLQNLIASYPEFALAYNDLGVLYHSGGNEEKALKYYERAVQLDPENSSFNKNLADFYYAEMGRVEDALQIYVKILEANPEDVETLLITGHICVALEKFPDAEVFYSRVLEIEPGYQDALQFLDKLNSMKADDLSTQTPEELYRGIQPLLNNGDPHRAISALEGLLEQFPDFAIAHNDLGVLCYHTGNKEKAQQHYEHAVELTPDNINFQKNLADFYCIELGRIEDALKIYVSSLKIAPRDVETLMATGQICAALEKTDDARDFFNKVLEIEPWNETACQHLEELERLPSTAVLKKSESPDEIYQRLQQNLNTLSQAEGIEEFEKLLGSYPDFALGHNDLGVLYYHNGDKEKTLQHYRQAAQLQPENLTFQKNLAEFVFVELGRIEEALQIYVNILALNPHDVETLLITGHICVTLKKFDDARDFYHRVLELEPGNEDAGNNLQELDKHHLRNDLLPSESASAFSALTDKLESDDFRSDRPAAGQQAATVSVIISLDGIQNRVKECIKSVVAHTPDPHEILLINRGATKGLLKWAQQLLKDNDQYDIIECAKRAGQTESINKAIQKASGEMVVLLHNDAVVPEGWLNAFKMCIDLVLNIGLVGPMTNRAAGIQQMIHSDEFDRAEFRSAAKTFYEQNQYRRVTTRKLSAFCLAFRRELPDKIGYLDEQFFSEDVVVEDFCNRSVAGGYQNLIAADTYVHHYDRHPVKKNATTKSPASTADRKKYKEKWNGTQNPEAKALQTVQLLARAEALSQKGQIDTAIETVLGAIGLQPENQRLYLALSEILITAKRFQDAKDALTEMPPADDNQEVRKAELLAYAEEGLENYEAAQTHIEQVLAMNPDRAQALNLKGILAYRNDDRPSAEKFFKRAIDADPGYGEPYTNLGMLQLEADQQEEALKSFEKGFRLTPTDFDIATNYHTLIAGIAEYQKAENVARNAAFLYPNNQKIKYMLIDFLIQQGKYEMAMPEIEDAIIKFGTDNEILSAALKVREKLGPITIQKSLEKVPVSLCMIIKDEEKYLARCLASVKPIVDEMIVVDTGSTDRSKDIAITFGAKVYDYEWKNDFAEARNYSISKASGEWILILDGDEVISPLDHTHFSKMVKKTPRVPIAYSIITRNYNKLANIVGWMPNDGTYPEEEAAIGWLPSEKVRLFYGKDQIWFEGAVHELVDPVLKKNGIEIKKCRLPVHHYGRLDNEELERKGEIYFDIGKKKLSAMGDDLNALRELAVQATILEKNQEAFELWQRLLSLNPIPNLAAIAYVNMGTIYSRLGKFEDALDAGKKAVKHDPDLKEARYNHAMAELHCGNAPKTIRVLEDLLKGFPDYPPARFILSAAYCCAHQKEKGLEGIRKLRDTPMGTHLDIPCLELAQSLISAGKMEYALWVLGAAIESDIVNPQLLVLFKECLNMKEATQKCSHIPQPPQANFQETILENLPQ